MIVKRTRLAAISAMLAGLALACTCSARSLAADDPSPGLDGKAILQKNCSRCHSIEATGDSPLKGAPPLREIYHQRNLERLEFELGEGMGSRHLDMPQIQFSTEEIAAILDYLSSIARTQ